MPTSSVCGCSLPERAIDEGRPAVGNYLSALGLALRRLVSEVRWAVAKR
jgi:hypothetical protein